MFAEPTSLILGLIFGIAFGFFLQKGRVAKYPVIIGQFLLKDWTVVKIMGTAVTVGSLGIYALHSTGLASLSVKPADIGAVVVGGVLFATGMAIFGYCPGTSVAGVGEGHKDAVVGVVGMLFGAAAYLAAFPLIQLMIKQMPQLGKVTIAQVTGTSPWLWVGLLLASLGVAYYMDRRPGLPQESSSPRHKPEIISTGLPTSL